MKKILSGEVKKIEFTRCFFKPSNVIFLDEPTSGVDNEFKPKILQMIKSIAENKIVIIATHDKKEEEISNIILKIGSKGVYTVANKCKNC